MSIECPRIGRRARLFGLPARRRRPFGRGGAVVLPASFWPVAPSDRWARTSRTAHQALHLRKVFRRALTTLRQRAGPLPTGKPDGQPGCGRSVKGTRPALKYTVALVGEEFLPGDNYLQQWGYEVDRPNKERQASCSCIFQRAYLEK